MNDKMKLPYQLSSLIAALMVAQSTLGLVFTEQYRDIQWIKATWIGNDIVTLCVAVPLLLLSLLFSKRRSTRAELLWLGMLGYSAYNYAYYMLGAALNIFFPLYIILLLLSTITLILKLSNIDTAITAERFNQKTPTRLIGGYLVFVAIGLGFVWLGMWGAYVFAGRPTPIEPDSFRLVASLDLSIIVTIFSFGGVLLWQRKPWGYIIASIAGIQGSLYLFVLSFNSLLAIVNDTVKAPGELPIWGTLVLFTTAATMVLLVNVRKEAQ